MIKKILLILLFSFQVQAVLTTQLQGTYQSDTDNSSNFKYNKLQGNFFFGASFGANDRLYIGQNIGKYSRSHQDNGSSNNQLSVMELGPRLLFYFNEMKSWYVGASWNPYARGTRTSATASEDVSGMSYQFSFGCQTRVSRQVGLGFSLNYHSLTLNKKVVNNISTDISESYTAILPMVELAFHFR